MHSLLENSDIPLTNNRIPPFTSAIPFFARAATACALPKLGDSNLSTVDQRQLSLLPLPTKPAVITRLFRDFIFLPAFRMLEIL